MFQGIRDQPKPEHASAQQAAQASKDLHSMVNSRTQMTFGTLGTRPPGGPQKSNAHKTNAARPSSKSPSNVGRTLGDGLNMKSQGGTQSKRLTKPSMSIQNSTAIPKNNYNEQLLKMSSTSSGFAASKVSTGTGNNRYKGIA